MKRPSVAIVGAGRLGTALALELHASGYRVAEVLTRDAGRSSLRRLVRQTGARVVGVSTAKLDADLIWLCVPDSQIAKLAGEIASGDWRRKIVFHASGVLSSEALEPLKRRGAAVASVHPLTTFIDGSRPELRGVTFAIEGDTAAVKAAFDIVRALKGLPVRIRKEDKAAYHAFASIVCPLLIALLASGEEAARLAGVSRDQARKRMLPIVRQTIANYMKFGAAKSFTGPIVRGDVDTVRLHLETLAKVPAVRGAYAGLAAAALALLPRRNEAELRKVIARLGKTKVKIPTSRKLREVAHPRHRR